MTKRLAEQEQDQRFAQRESELTSAIQSLREEHNLIAKNKHRDEMLMQTIREIQEVKKLLAASDNKKLYEFWK
nr:DUF3967 domain-containing protein [Bacillus sp. H1m]